MKKKSCVPKPKMKVKKCKVYDKIPIVDPDNFCEEFYENRPPDLFTEVENGNTVYNIRGHRFTTLFGITTYLKNISEKNRMNIKVNDLSKEDSNIFINNLITV